MKSSIFVLALFVIAFVGCNKKGNNNNENMQNSTAEMSDTMSNSNMNKDMNNGMVMADNSDFTADLSGDNEVPNAINTDAGGEAYFKVNDDHTKVMYTLKVSSLKNVIMAHIHAGTSGENGPIAIWLYPGTNEKHKMMKQGMTNGVLKSGTITQSDLGGPMKGKTISDLIDAMKNGKTYVNVHTKAHPEGEIRGPIKGGDNMMHDNNMKK